MKDSYVVFPHPSLDWRLSPTRHTNVRMPAKHFFSKEEVDARREELVFGLRMSAGLYPWPEKTPLNTRMELVSHEKGYSVYKIMYESFPGFWSTGNVYMPNPITGKHPAILYCMGHFEDQRLTRIEEKIDVPQQLANFARLGFVSLVPDMIGKVDSKQITHDYGREEKDLWLSNGLGVQLWNNIRALDVLCDMPEVDAERIGMTGCSGGGTQTLTLTMVDDRIKAAAPINMISLEMQGGCQCENAPGLRRESENCEMCCMLAPTPLFLAGSTGDWTRNQQTIEEPVIRETYALYGAEDKVVTYYQVAGHQYNAKTRNQVYAFFARELMGTEPNWVEQPIVVEDVQDLTWFRGEGHAPGFNNDEEFFQAHKAELAQRTANLNKEDKMKMLTWVTGIKGQQAFIADPTVFPMNGMTMEHNAAITSGGVQVPYIRLIPDNWDGKRVVLALSGEGKDCLDKPEIQQLVKDGAMVISGDLFMLGEVIEGIKRPITDPQGLRHFNCFHYTEDGCRIQDAYLLWQVACQSGSECSIWADGAAARAVAAALPFLKDVKACKLEADALKLESDADYLANFNVPGIMLVGGLEGCLALADSPVDTF